MEKGFVMEKKGKAGTSPSTPNRNDFGPTASWPHLRLRAEMLRRLRRFFEERNFLEVETPLLSADSVVDRYLDPLRVTLFDDVQHPATGRPMWLQTSPEFGMKRLLAAGAPSIFQVAKAFRGGGEVGALHNPEFTIVEWYGVGDSYEAGMQLVCDLVAALPLQPRSNNMGDDWTQSIVDLSTGLLGIIPPSALSGNGPDVTATTMDFQPTSSSPVTLSAGLVTEKISYQAAFQQHAGLDPHLADVATMKNACAERGLAPPPSLDPHDRDQWLNFLLATCVEPQLGKDRPTILYDYPASQAALARVRPGEPPCAERFELYFHGVELANGYHELLDPAVLRTRNQVTNQQRAAEGKYQLPDESRLLAAMEHGLPNCTGVALGFDRLVMLAAGARQIADVIAFPVDRA